MSSAPATAKTVPNRLPRLSITGEPTGAGSFPPRRSSSPGRSTCSSHHAQIDGAVRWSLPRLRAVQCCSAPIDFNHQPAREEMAIDEAELEPLEFAEKMHTQRELQQQKLEMLVQIRKHNSESQSVILETLQRQLESADFDTSASIFTPEQIQGIVEKYSSSHISRDVQMGDMKGTKERERNERRKAGLAPMELGRRGVSRRGSAGARRRSRGSTSTVGAACSICRGHDDDRGLT
ncbi:uncharacterized protein [Triticum aestivum]|uniref:Uncharacterized protein n=1 Tax=Triticum aestivum TaxID=4565 RepID=A0A3B5Y4A7_WHEAT|nr:uncharacterized protein LOC123061775 isoform X2 [Triticum aestivum]XP_044340993.1 uncharacterized protein LOC123061775 isoform X2 [Triticum aestivum]